MISVIWCKYWSGTSAKCARALLQTTLRVSCLHMLIKNVINLSDCPCCVLFVLLDINYICFWNTFFFTGFKCWFQTETWKAEIVLTCKEFTQNRTWVLGIYCNFFAFVTSCIISNSRWVKGVLIFKYWIEICNVVKS